MLLETDPISDLIEAFLKSAPAWLGIGLAVVLILAGSRVLGTFIDLQFNRRRLRREFDQRQTLAALEALHAFTSEIETFGRQPIPRNTEARDKTFATLGSQLRAAASATSSDLLSARVDSFIDIGTHWGSGDQDTSRVAEQNAYKACLTQVRIMLRKSR